MEKFFEVITVGNRLVDLIYNGGLEPDEDFADYLLPILAFSLADAVLYDDEKDDE